MQPGKNTAFALSGSNNSFQYLLIWECLYFTSAMFVKCAISLTMLRVAAKKSHKIALWTIIAFVIMTGLTGVIGGLTVCHPIEKNWDPTATPEDCAYGAVLVIGFVVTATSILTDFACAGLPILVLWNMQMDRRLKVLTWLMLALGARYVQISQDFLRIADSLDSASLSTIIRIPYLKYWSINKDQLCKCPCMRVYVVTNNY